jgi:hypothetical protein
MDLDPKSPITFILPFTRQEMDIMDPMHLTTNGSDDELRLTPANLQAINALYTDSPIDCSDISDADIDLPSSALQSESITAAKRAIGNFTGHKLKTLDIWEQWHAAKTKQLDQFHELGRFGKPVYPPSGTIFF